ncbi:hypothetical protein B0H16DRAFT_1470898 [Mycena metata]|uniref:Uncharacterized protein n=1 Tax=Mycena metata TaxID=1033252 RepID=A0AAD7HSW9_9AGAR|nr:hypothetical protein B0H16DRAFT_1470898 [Mycena metata]
MSARPLHASTGLNPETEHIPNTGNPTSSIPSKSAPALGGGVHRSDVISVPLLVSTSSAPTTPTIPEAGEHKECIVVERHAAHPTARNGKRRRNLLRKVQKLHNEELVARLRQRIAQLEGNSEGLSLYESINDDDFEMEQECWEGRTTEEIEAEVECREADPKNWRLILHEHKRMAIHTDLSASTNGTIELRMNFLVTGPSTVFIESWVAFISRRRVSAAMGDVKADIASTFSSEEIFSWPSHPSQRWTRGRVCRPLPRVPDLPPYVENERDHGTWTMCPYPTPHPHRVGPSNFTHGKTAAPTETSASSPLSRSGVSTCGAAHLFSASVSASRPITTPSPSFSLLPPLHAPHPRPLITHSPRRITPLDGAAHPPPHECPPDCLATANENAWEKDIKREGGNADFFKAAREMEGVDTGAETTNGHCITTNTTWSRPTHTRRPSKLPTPQRAIPKTKNKGKKRLAHHVATYSRYTAKGKNTEKKRKEKGRERRSTVLSASPRVPDGDEDSQIPIRTRRPSQTPAAKDEYALPLRVTQQPGTGVASSRNLTCEMAHDDEAPSAVKFAYFVQEQEKDGTDKYGKL